MPVFLLVCAAVSLLLLGCRIEEKQKQAADLVESAAEDIAGGIEAAKHLQEKVGATAVDVQKRVEQLQKGAAKVTGAVGTLKDGVQEVGGALNVSGEKKKAE